MSTLKVRAETRVLEARREGEDPRANLASGWLLCEVAAPEPQGAAVPRRPANVALVLDRSGSMRGRPLDFAREGASLAIGLLRDGDRFSVVAYDDRVDVVVPSGPATEAARRAARESLAQVFARGSTDLHGGWLQGCEEVARGMSEGSESRCLLLTDGLANQGVTDAGEIAKHAGELLRRGIVTSTFGLGDGFDEVLLQRMAEAGGGNAYWVREPSQIGPAMEAELGDSLEVVARNAELVVEGRGVAEVLVPGVGRLPRDGEGRFRHRLGSLSGGQVRSEALHVRLRRRRAGRPSAVRVWLEDADGALPREGQEASWAFVAPADAAAAPLDADVVVATRSALVQGLVVESLKVDRDTDLRERVRRLDREAARLAAIVDRVPRLAPVLDELREAAARLDDQAFLMDAGRVKEAMFSAWNVLKGRDADGRARRGRGEGRLHVRLLGEGMELSRLAGRLSWLFETAARGQARCFVDDGPALPPTGPADRTMTREEQQKVVGPIGTPLDGEPVTIVLTPRPLEGNRFSAWHPQSRAAVVSLAGTAEASRAPVEAFVAYEVLLHGLRLSWPEWNPESLMHAETRGCLFDLCRVRSDLDVKLHAASLCHFCRERLRRSRVDTGLVDAYLSVVRDLSAAARAGVN